MLNDSNIPAAATSLLTAQVSSDDTTNRFFNSSSVYLDFDFDMYLTVRKTITWISLLVACMGLLGNLFSFLVLINPKMRTTTNIFLANLCISSFIALVCLMINSIVYEITFYYGPDLIHHLILVIYPYVYPIANTFQMACIMLTVSVSFNQFLCIYFSRVRSYSKMSTMAEHKKTYYTVSGIYAFSIIYCIPYWFKFQYDPASSSLRTTDIASNKHFNRIVYFWMYLPIAYIIPFSVLFFTNAYLLTKLMVAKQKRKSLGIIANINYNKSVSGGDRTPSQHASGNIRIASISNTTKSLITARSKGLLRNNRNDRRKSSSPNRLNNLRQLAENKALNRQLEDMGGGGGPRRVSVSSGGGGGAAAAGSNNSSFQFHKESSVRIKKRRLITSNKLGRTKITCMLVVVVFFFFFCQFPNLIIHVIQSIHCADSTPDSETGDDETTGGGTHNKCASLGLFSYGFIVSKFLIILNLSFNFWCYCFFSEKFREVSGELITGGVRKVK